MADDALANGTAHELALRRKEGRSGSCDTRTIDETAMERGHPLLQLRTEPY